MDLFMAPPMAVECLLTNYTTMARNPIKSQKREKTHFIHPGWFLVFLSFFLDLVETYDLHVDLFPGLGQSLVNVNNNVALNLLDVSK